MARTVEQIEAEALDLAGEARARLVRRLILNFEEQPTEHPAGVKAAWEEEIERRIAEVDAGTAELIPAEVVFSDIRRRLKQ
jgi:putative addiction module component (TIGR02574 family)